MTILFDSARPVQIDPAFGALPYQERRTYYEPSPEDAAWAAALFEELDQARYRAEKDRELEEQAAQARWDDQYAGAFPAGCCQMCGVPSDQLDRVHQLCPECLDRAEHATLAGQNERAGLGYRVF
jgi:hypothetical protein